MRRRTRRRKVMVVAALAALALGALGSGCLWKRGDHTLGSFCAAAVGGEEHCVGENLGPGNAWSKAEKDGSLPIEMWATWPGDKTLDDVVARTHRLDQWFGHLDEAIEYVRDDARNAESLRATLSGKLASLLDEATDRQRALLAQTPVDAARAPRRGSPRTARPRRRRRRRTRRSRSRRRGRTAKASTAWSRRCSRRPARRAARRTSSRRR
ncbi:hypothetical protein [Sorangium cellulosum]|uniref:hypothetical protein n=1 Tax=Sorangium cellulosum TaxID=56 RepID=UPI00133187E7|nr:hypothetical protein [Sorangium cellulosum]